MNKEKVAIIGAGIAGICTAIRLALKGYSIAVFESNDYPGGKLSEIQLNGFRFDAGPSLFTIPQYVDELFELAGENPRDHFNYKRLDVVCNYFYEDGTSLSGYADVNEFANEIEGKLGEDRQNVLAALQNSEFLYDHLGDLFVRRPIHSARTFLTKDAFKSYTKLHKLDFFRTMNQANESLFKEEKVVQLFNRYATYNGSDPYQTPATMNIIPHLEFNQGAFFPEGGMHSITKSLYELAKRCGVHFLFGQKVSAIEVDGSLAESVCIGKKKIKFDHIVSNMDMVNTYKYLLPDEKHPKKLLSQPKSSSALIFYWGIAQQFPELDLHNIFFSGDYRNEFDHIFKKGSICNDPTVYVNISSKCRPEDAPDGSENWFTMINVPNNSGQDWDSLIQEARKNIIHKLSRMLNTDLVPLIQAESVLDPRLIESKTSSSQGALYGNSSNNKYAAFLRHANFSKRIKNLYFCGGSVHPGGGIPLSISSAKLVADLFPVV